MWLPTAALAMSGSYSRLFEALFLRLEIGQPHGGNVTGYVKELWLDLLLSGLKEAQWSATKAVPEMNEYMSNGSVSFALGPIVLPALFLIGPKLSEAAVRSQELLDMFELMSTCGRLLNDIQTFKMLHGGMSEEEAISSVKDWVMIKRRELLSRVLGEGDDGSRVPRACRDLFWKMSTIVRFFYIEEDGFSSQKMADIVKDLLQRPIVLEDEL